MKLSMTLVSLAVGVLTYVVREAGLEIAPEQAQSFVETLVLVGSAIGVWYGRFRHGDITWFGARK